MCIHNSHSLISFDFPFPQVVAPAPRVETPASSVPPADSGSSSGSGPLLARPCPTPRSTVPTLALPSNPAPNSTNNGTSPSGLSNDNDTPAARSDTPAAQIDTCAIQNASSGTPVNSNGMGCVHDDSSTSETSNTLQNTVLTPSSSKKTRGKQPQLKKITRK